MGVQGVRPGRQTGWLGRYHPEIKAFLSAGPHPESDTFTGISETLFASPFLRLRGAGLNLQALGRLVLPETVGPLHEGDVVREHLKTG